MRNSGDLGIGLTLDVAGGPQTVPGWLGAFAVLAAGIAMGRWLVVGPR
jgi:hypothetical protein